MKRFKSRKAKKKALHLKQSGHEGMLLKTGTLHRMMPGAKIVERLKKVFGSSKHRTARVARFNARQRGSR